MGARPRIGITLSDNRRQSGWWLLSIAVWVAGGRACLITTTRREHAEDFDGLLIGGGVDVHPDRYGGEVKSGYAYEPERDQLEMDCLHAAEFARKPVLGICRGAQLINVSRGGTLCLDVAKTYERAEYPSGIWARFFYRKPVSVVGSSLTGRLLRSDRCEVNSMHSQSILQVGNGLAVTAIEDNGVVQAVEDPAKNFLLGVQFHPEYLIYRPKYRRIFRELTSQAARFAGM